MTRFSRTYRLVLLGGILLTLSSALYGFFWYQISTQSATFADLEAEIARASTLTSDTVALRSLIRDTENDRALLESAFLSDDDLIEFLELIEGLGTTTKTEVTVVSVGTGSAQGGNENQYNLSISGEGSWSGVYHLFMLIQALPVAVIIDRVRFETTGDATLPWQVLIDFTVERSL